MTDPQRAVLFLRVPAIAPEREAAYEKWYDEVHIPYRMDKPHFLGAQRYEVLAGRQRYFVFYELESIEALASEPYLALRKWEAAQPPDSFEGPGSSRPGFERGVYEQVAGPQWPTIAVDAPVAYVAGHDPVDEDAFAAWHDDVHAPTIARVPGVLGMRRFVLTKRDLGPQSGLRTERPRCMAVYYLESERAAGDAAFLRELDAARAAERNPVGAPYVIVGKRVYVSRARSAT